ncbi:hypothetical protein LRS05_03250 [Flavobacterium sp. J372]|uniref:DUF6688 domain-containing protein n=1 Tax=Flavobacterium sp. J372 TaxID=2898436 RepID=UPI002150B0FE|nr:DUF6688 family protein [Flavobacterium sp. J372]MCR5861220.1 hypothetical protein [Flavobacterium sp. J372]
MQLLHNFTIQAGKLPVMAFILIIPYVAISTLVLIIFGQEPDSAIKVFTDTSLWRLSQQMHPPILNHNGHYLCTVAAKGNPKLVKPLAVGTRAGQKIIVNRQLQIANAFEELVGDISPACHKMIRKNYDRYGYNLSKKINTSIRSDITYILMKPLEWVFLITLYMFCNKPESKITKQYLK